MRIGSLLLVLLNAIPVRAPAQLPGQAGPLLGTVTGVVHDSLAGAPLARATVQLVRSDDPAFSRTTQSDSAGKYTLADLPAGRYTIGFLHPVLDSIGIEAPMRAVVVDGARPDTMDLAVPGSASIRRAICIGGTGADSGAVAFGVVRWAGTGAPVAGATVTVAWMEFTFGSGRFTQRMPRRVATADAYGAYSLCGLPGGGTMAIVAHLGADSTDAFDVEPSAAGLLRRDLYLGRARTAAASTSNRPGGGDSLEATRRWRAGDGRLHGTVAARDGGRPIAGARVRIDGGAAAETNGRGEWALSGLPTGTRTLEVRALGFYPVRRPVDIVTDAPPVHIALATLQSVLDTVRVIASRTRLEGTGFDGRRRSGMGRYLTAADIAKRRVITIANLLGTLPGIRLDRNLLGDTRISVRGPFGRCTPAVYVNGHHMGGLSAEELESWASPEEIAGMEIYTGAMVPPEFSEGMTGCGSIVIWTRPVGNAASAWSWKRRIAQGGGAILLGVITGVLLGRM